MAVTMAIDDNKKKTLVRDLAGVLNAHGIDTLANAPDYVLAESVVAHLANVIALVLVRSEDVVDRFRDLTVSD